MVLKRLKKVLKKVADSLEKSCRWFLIRLQIVLKKVEDGLVEGNCFFWKLEVWKFVISAVFFFGGGVHQIQINKNFMNLKYSECIFLYTINQ